MAYNNNIPLSTDNISVSQGNILTNFGTSGIDSTSFGFSRNHVSMTDGTNGGLHKAVDFYQPIASPTLGGTGGVAYPKTVTNSELFFKNSVSDMQISNSLLTASSGQGMLPGGLQVRCGTSSFPGQNQYVNFSIAFPIACLSVVVSNANSGNNASTINVTSIQPNRFQVFCPNGAGSNLSYMAIGY